MNWPTWASMPSGSARSTCTRQTITVMLLKIISVLILRMVQSMIFATWCRPLTNAASAYWWILFPTIRRILILIFWTRRSAVPGRHIGIFTTGMKMGTTRITSSGRICLIWTTITRKSGAWSPKPLPTGFASSMWMGFAWMWFGGWRNAVRISGPSGGASLSVSSRTWCCWPRPQRASPITSITVSMSPTIGPADLAAGPGRSSGTPTNTGCYRITWPLP